MRAAQFHVAGDIRIEDIPTPNPDDSENNDQVLVEVEWCGICGSDLNEYLFGPFAIPSPKKGPHPLTHALLPLPMGHEFSGRISHVPNSIAETSHLRKGQPVAIDPRYFCSSCIPCTQSATNSCDKLGFMGISGKWGGFSEAVAVDSDHVYVLPDKLPGGEEVDLAAAALIEPLAVAWHAVKLFLSIAPYQAGAPSQSEKIDFSSIPILVVGAGPVGVATVFVLRARGARTIFVSETSKARRDMLADTGIVSDIVDPLNDDVTKRIKDITDDGVSAVFDCAGAQGGYDAGCASLRFRGVYVNLALPKAPITIPIMPFLWKEIMYKCSLAYDEQDFKETVDAFVSGRFKGVEKMITRRLDLNDIVEQGFKELIKPNDHIKILATPKKGIVKPDITM
ncbi:hypothetical protein BDV06DRAFT_215749 [Aspergillus oleicola]